MRLFSYDFLITNIPIISSQPGPGMAPAVVGTLLITGAATAMAVPLGVLGRDLPQRVRQATPRWRVFIRLMTDVMTGVPSIVMGLFIYTIWVLRYGLSGLAGALALACLMLPIVVRTSEEMLRLVPGEPARGERGARRPHVAHHRARRAARRAARHRERRHAGRGACRGRDRAAAVHDRHRVRSPTPACSAPTPRCRRRSSGTRRCRSPPPRTGRGPRRSR